MYSHRNQIVPVELNLDRIDPRPNLLSGRLRSENDYEDDDAQSIDLGGSGEKWEDLRDPEEEFMDREVNSVGVVNTQAQELTRAIALWISLARMENKKIRWWTLRIHSLSTFH